LLIHHSRGVWDVSSRLYEGGDSRDDVSSPSLASGWLGVGGQAG